MRHLTWFLVRNIEFQFRSFDDVCVCVSVDDGAQNNTHADSQSGLVSSKKVKCKFIRALLHLRQTTTWTHTHTNDWISLSGSPAKKQLHGNVDDDDGSLLGCKSICMASCLPAWPWKVNK